MSKKMPKHMAVGIWNAGFISSQAGTMGRALGNFSITIAGSINENKIENILFIPMQIMLIASLFLIYS